MPISLGQAASEHKGPEAASGQGCARETPGTLCLLCPVWRPGCLRSWQERSKKSPVRQEPQLCRVTVSIGDKRVWHAPCERHSCSGEAAPPRPLSSRSSGSSSSGLTTLSLSHPARNMALWQCLQTSSSKVGVCEGWCQRHSMVDPGVRLNYPHPHPVPAAATPPLYTVSFLKDSRLRNWGLMKSKPRDLIPSVMLS